MLTGSWYGQVPSPLGPLALHGQAAGLVQLGFQDGPRPLPKPPGATWLAALPWDLENALAAYFAGTARGFQVPLAPRPGTPFQHQVWAALAALPYGQVTTYGALAAQLGRPHAARAVGAACGANPVPLVVPCHRVVASTGGLGGYLGGLAAKQYLLQLEQAGRDAG